MTADQRLIVTRHGLNVDVVERLIVVESGGNAWAWNPEPAYRYLWNVRTNVPFRALTANEGLEEAPPHDFHALVGDPDQEWWAQQASWGLMQVMGAVAREHGFSGNYLSELCDPLVGLEYGCRHLAADLRWANGNVAQALAAYNGGRGGNAMPPFRNAAYAAKILNA